MKKLKLIISIAAAAALFSSGAAQVSGLEYGGRLTYTRSSEGIVITGFKGAPDVLDLPAAIEGVPVTEIRENAFYKCVTLRKVVVPESVGRIGHHAFFGCTALESAEIKGCVAELPEGVFYGCERLTEVSLNSSTRSIGDYAFFDCRSLRSFEFPAAVKDTGSYSFAECRSLSRIFMNSRLRNIGQYSFYNCRSLERFSLPDGLMSIGNHAIGFSGEGVLSGVTITGPADSIASHYAENSGVKFRSRIRYGNRGVSLSAVSGFLAWCGSAVVYGLLMAVFITGKKHGRRRN